MDEDGNIIPSVEGMGVDDPIMDNLIKNRGKFEKAEEEIRDRKNIDIITPV